MAGDGFKVFFFCPQVVFTFPAGVIYQAAIFSADRHAYRLRILPNTLRTSIRHYVIMFFRPEHVEIQSLVTINIIPVLDLPPVRASFINCVIRTHNFTDTAITAEAGYLYRHGFPFPQNTLRPENSQTLLFKYKHLLLFKK